MTRSSELTRGFGGRSIAILLIYFAMEMAAQLLLS
jgi:hypothetical protein